MLSGNTAVEEWVETVKGTVRIIGDMMTERWETKL